MLNRLFGKNTHSYILIFGLCVLAIGVPINKIVMSLAMMFLALNFLLEGEYKTKWRRLISNKAFILLALFFVLHFIGFIWSSNMEYAWNDIRVKLPLLVIPLIIIAKPPANSKHINYILIAFVASTFFSSAINVLFYENIIGHREYDDIRGLSLFGSHIRYAIIVTMSIGILISFFKLKKYRITLIVLILWFIFYTFYSQVLSGVITLFAVISVFSIYLIWKKWKVAAFVLVGGIVIAVVSMLLWVFKPMRINKENYKNLETNTAEGNPYEHQFNKVTVETGEPTYIYVCESELRREWAERSALSLDSLDLIGQPLKQTLIRYMSSKNIRKDSAGVNKLTKKEIRNIEMGHASIVNSGIIARFYGIKHQLNNAKTVNNHSILERIRYWKAGIFIIKSNWLIGVGTGDIQDAFNQQYEDSNSQLSLENRHRTHNMYLTVFITFGIGGLILFCWMLIHFTIYNIRKHDLVGLFFILIAVVSFIPEDTLETQTGVTFFALFYGLHSISLVSKKRQLHP